MIKIDRLKIVLLYFFMLTGGLWHIFNVLQEIMSLLAGPLLIGLSIWLYYEIIKNENNKHIFKFNIWAILVVIISFLIEAVGVTTGLIFGTYTYGAILWPQIMNVPIAIGFAWFTMLICSIALAQHLPGINNPNIWLQIFIASILMTFFDYMMEPAAITLNYWTWSGGNVPIQNYSAWFLISFLFLLIGKQMYVHRIKMPVLAVNVFFAQLMYFILIMLK